MKMIYKLILFTSCLSSFGLYAQEDCFRLDKKTNIAYNKNDNNLFSDTCKGFYENGKPQYYCQFDSGIIKKCLHWDKQGILLDSTVYTRGFDDKKIVYQLYENGSLQSIVKWKLYKSPDSLSLIIISEEKYFNKDGKIKQELIHFNDKKKHYILKEFYKNGNIKSSGLFYDSKSFLGLCVMRKDSIYTEFSEEGKIIIEKMFRNDKEVIK